MANVGTVHGILGPDDVVDWAKLHKIKATWYGRFGNEDWILLYSRYRIFLKNVPKDIG